MNIIWKETTQTVKSISETCSIFSDEVLFRNCMSVRPKLNNNGINLPANKVGNSCKVEIQ